MKMLSTMCDPHTTQTVERKQKDGSEMTIPCPEAVVVYNKYMGGVDQGDQLRHYYRIRTKCVKNYKYIFWFLVDVIITNAYILSRYSPVISSMRSLKSFWLTLATQLLDQKESRTSLLYKESSTSTSTTVASRTQWPFCLTAPT